MRTTIVNSPLATRDDRLKVYLSVVENDLREGASPVAKLLRDELTAPTKPEGEIALFFRYAVTQHRSPVGFAWKEYFERRRAVIDALRAPDGTLPVGELFSFDDLPHLDNFLANLAACIDSVRESEPDDEGMFALLGGLTQLHGLSDWIETAHKPLDRLARGRASVEYARLRDFFHVGWLAPELPISVLTIRDAWSHGSARLEGRTLQVYDRRGTQRLAALGHEHLLAALGAGLATWTAVHLEFVASISYGASTFQPRDGRAS